VLKRWIEFMSVTSRNCLKKVTGLGRRRRRRKARWFIRIWLVVLTRYSIKTIRSRKWREKILRKYSETILRTWNRIYMKKG